MDQWGTERPIEDFEKGFLGQADDELRDYYRLFLAKRDSMGTISKNWMAVLDENSAAQSAVVMHYGMKKSDWDELNEARSDESIPGTGRVCDDRYIWWKWRIPFRNAYSFFTGLDSTGEETLGLYCHTEYINADGILDVETVDKVMDGELPDTYGVLKGNAEESEDEDGS